MMDRMDNLGAILPHVRIWRLRPEVFAILSCCLRFLSIDILIYALCLIPQRCSILLLQHLKLPDNTLIKRLIT